MTNERALHKFLNIDEIMQLPDPQYLIDGVLPNNAFVVLYGAPGTGKTFVAISMALCLMIGHPWMGRRTRKIAVLYIAAEGASGFKVRIPIFRRRHEIPHTVKGMIFLNYAINFLDKAQVDHLIASIKASGEIPKLVIIDTLARCFVGGDENSSKDMGALVANVEKLQAALGATILVIHHSAKATNVERGSSALRGAADAMFCCERNKDSPDYLGFECIKMKEGEEFEKINLKLEKIAWNGKTSLAVASWTGAIPEQKNNKALNENQEAALEILKTFGEKGATNAEWQKSFREKTGKSESVFDRILRLLRTSAVVQLIGSGQGARYIIVPPQQPVSVSEQCQPGVTIPDETGVISPPLLGGDTDTDTIPTQPKTPNQN